MSYEHVSRVEVGICFDQTQEVKPVGILIFKGRIIEFEFENSFIEDGIEISPFECKLKTGLRSFERNLFEGLPGVFADSLPDYWGRKLLNIMLMRENVITHKQITPLDRLAHLGVNGLGALVYEPQLASEKNLRQLAFKHIARDLHRVREGDEGSPISQDSLSKLQYLSGAAGGARPKIVVGLDAGRKKILLGERKLPAGFEHWLVKFPAEGESVQSGAIEYVYALMAKEAGLEMEEVHLLEAGDGAGLFATKLFDRSGARRWHMHTAAGLLHHDFTYPTLDYKQLVTLTMVLTRDIREAEKMFRLAVFNVLAHNRDDHGKNFSFLMDAAGEWRLAPAYDLTYCGGPGGQHSTTLMGKGADIGSEDFARLGEEAMMPREVVDDAIVRTSYAVSRWPVLAKEHGIRPDLVGEIGGRLKLDGKQLA